MKDSILCFYHANCTDGAAAAAVIHRKYPKAELIPMNHGDAITVPLEGKKVFVVDFSFPYDVFVKMKSEAKEIFWYDHHKTAIPIQEKLGWGTMDLSESGASLTWKMEYPQSPLPSILAYVKDKDIWEWKLPHSREISAAIRDLDEIHDPASDTWRKLIENLGEERFQNLVEIGKVVLRSQRMRIEEGGEKGFEVDFHGYKTLAVNWSFESSEMGEYIYKDLKYEVALIFFYTGKIWNFSLRSDRVDVSELAKKYGGGGHPGASGFRTEEIEWLLKLQKKPA